MRISDWSSDVCSSDLIDELVGGMQPGELHVYAASATSWVTSTTVLPSVANSSRICACSSWRMTGSSAPSGSSSRSEERSVGKECVRRVDVGGRRTIKKKKPTHKLQNNAHRHHT